jgi:hypothetical protein
MIPPGKSNFYILLAGMLISAATLEIIMEVPQKAKNRTIMRCCYATPRHISKEM